MRIALCAEIYGSYYFGVRVRATLEVACPADSSPSERRQLHPSNTVHRRLTPICEDHTSIDNSTQTKQPQQVCVDSCSTDTSNVTSISYRLICASLTEILQHLNMCFL